MMWRGRVFQAHVQRPWGRREHDIGGNVERKGQWKDGLSKEKCGM